MSGHSKWSKVKHQKESTDALKGKIFTKMASAIIIAVKEGGGITDPSSNFRLRLAVEKARQANMPKENIERAIEKGAGRAEGGNFERIVYEAFGPGKIGLLIETATDSHQRTTAEIKNILERGGGVLAAKGSVSYQFDYVGLIKIPKEYGNIDEITNLAIDVGGEDVEELTDLYIIYTRPADLHKVKENLESKGIKIIDAELFYKPKSYLSINDELKLKLNTLIEAIQNSEDVHKVYANYR